MPKSAPCGAGVQLVTLPEGSLSPMLLRNSVLHLEDFYRRRDILRGFLGGGGIPLSHRLSTVTSENGSLLGHRSCSEILEGGGPSSSHTAAQ